MVRRGSVKVVRGPGPQWGSADRGSVFSGYPKQMSRSFHDKLGKVLVYSPVGFRPFSSEVPVL